MADPQETPNPGNTRVLGQGQLEIILLVENTKVFIFLQPRLSMRNHGPELQTVEGRAPTPMALVSEDRRAFRGEPHGQRTGRQDGGDRKKEQRGNGYVEDAFQFIAGNGKI